MRYCPSCLEEYEDGTERCAECEGETLVSEEELSRRPEFRRVHPDEDTTAFAVAGTAEDPFDADAFVAAIGDAGIPVLVRMRRGSSVEALTVSVPRPWWDILVPEAQRERAAQLIAETRAEVAAGSAEAEMAAEQEELATEAKA